MLVAFELLRNTLGCIFLRCFALRFQEKTYAKNQGSLAHMQCFAAFIVETNKRFLLFFIQQEISKPGFFAYFFPRKQRVKQRNKNAAQCISSNLKATSKNSGTFENTQNKVDFPLSIVFDQTLQLLQFPQNHH